MLQFLLKHYRHQHVIICSNGCTQLKYAPTVNFHILNTNSCYRMFKDCTELLSAPKMDITEIKGSHACYAMFDKCSSLSSGIGEFNNIPVTQYAFYCLYQDCTNLKENIPTRLPEYTENRSYAYMFKNCTSLKTFPELPAINLAEKCYSNLFEGCTELINAPELPATEGTNACYNSMFKNCSNLTSVNVALTSWTDINGNNYTTDWLNGVAETGTFTKSQELNEERGISRIPENWTVQNI